MRTRHRGHHPQQPTAHGASTKPDVLFADIDLDCSHRAAGLRADSRSLRPIAARRRASSRCSWTPTACALRSAVIGGVIVIAGAPHCCRPPSSTKPSRQPRTLPGAGERPRATKLVAAQRRGARFALYETPGRRACARPAPHLPAALRRRSHGCSPSNCAPIRPMRASVKLQACFRARGSARSRGASACRRWTPRGVWPVDERAPRDAAREVGRGLRGVRRAATLPAASSTEIGEGAASADDASRCSASTIRCSASAQQRPADRLMASVRELTQSSAPPRTAHVVRRAARRRRRRAASTLAGRTRTVRAPAGSPPQRW